MADCNYDLLIEKLKVFCPDLKVSEPMSRHTTFKVGGPCKAFVEVKELAQLENVLELCKSFSAEYFILGKGSNILVADEGWECIVIKPCGDFNLISFNEETNEISAGCGVSLASLSSFACEKGIAGFEFASGIPGTVGGGIRMNAGAYGGEMSQIVDRCTFMMDGEIKTLKNNELDFGYRHSIFSEIKNCIILQTVFKSDLLDSSENIRARMTELNLRRKEKQPLEYASAGSTFKRPSGMFAGKLIEDAGLKGFSKGDACVSEKHAGFVVNKGSADCADIIFVMDHVRKIIFEKFGVVLEPEVIILGNTRLKEVSVN